MTPTTAPPAPSATLAPDLAAAGARVHCIGIGGCGLSGLACVLAEAGAVVSGSDDVPGELTADLQRHGIPVTTRLGAAARVTGQHYDIGAFVRKMEQLYVLLHRVSRATRRRGVLEADLSFLTSHAPA